MQAFGETGITSIDLPDGLKTLEQRAFLDCTGLTSITLPDSITTMGAWAFKGTRLTEIRTPVQWDKVVFTKIGRASCRERVFRAV